MTEGREAEAWYIIRLVSEAVKLGRAQASAIDAHRPEAVPEHIRKSLDHRARVWLAGWDQLKLEREGEKST